ncbi:MAG: NeuD/PglB/VioB family sugar acetyltransferase [bacterium]
MIKNLKNKRKVAIYGAGFQGRIVFEILQKCKCFDILYFIDDFFKGDYLYNIPVIKNYEISSKINIVLAIGNDDYDKIQIKKNIINKIDLEFINAIDTSSIVSKYAVLGKNIICHPNTVIMTGSKIGNFSIISTGSCIDHDNVLESFANICPGVRTAGNVHIGTGVFLGTGAIILPKVKIGQYAIIGAGAVVTNDIPAFATAVGVPARIIKRGLKPKLNLKVNNYVVGSH